MLPVVILAGGLATRLYPLTKSKPKALLEIAGRPFIDQQILLLKEKGVKEIILCLGNFGGMIEEHLGNGSRFNVSIKYSYDGDKLLGTGGAVKKASSILPEDFIITYGDSYLDIEIKTVVSTFYEKGLPLLMTVYKNRNMFDKSNVTLKDGNIIKYDKTGSDPSMEYIDYGMIVTKKDIFDRYPPDKAFDLSLVLSEYADLGLVSSYEAETRFYETGSLQGIKETEEYILNRKPRQM
ncbi:NDP-sugar pyrophosphorylase family protein [Methanomicrobium sp. W14]|uniref:sugar phosphate nucleotidyltransferase n=1 Tax=Methanomicrobium sp. W14 TaxID=2817839 RepID=UPI001AE7B79D|nr:sugar phosphate nucleotidyltransferase [Methanomicrobium sp. W14]MBP2134438.1 NDP-sugar pyrophosphorylase family protein [Methanomicrobium sp. W14]